MKAKETLSYIDWIRVGLAIGMIANLFSFFLSNGMEKMVFHGILTIILLLTYAVSLLLEIRNR